MVYCGKPSKGCSNCRERKIRCDQKELGCTQCARSNKECPGYRNQLDLMFRDESKSVTRKAKAKAKKNTDGGTEPYVRKKAISPVVVTEIGPVISTQTQLSDTGNSSPVTCSPGDSLVLQDQVKDDEDACENCLTQLELFRGESSNGATFIKSLIPTAEDLATGFFNANYMHPNGARGNFDFVPKLYSQSSTDSHLTSSMTAVGLAGFANTARSPELMRQARANYVTALRLINQGIQSPATATKDSLLLSIMLLSVFETVTGNSQKSLKAWTEHVNGAAALIKLRGHNQFRSKTGVRLFLQMVSSLMISCVQRGIAMPPHILVLRRAAAKYIDTSDPSWQISESILKFIAYRSDVRNGMFVTDESMLNGALAIDALFKQVSSNLPGSWQYKTVYTTADPDMVWNGHYHVYSDYWIAQILNALRTCRILVNEYVRDCLLRAFLETPPRWMDREHTDMFHVAAKVECAMRDEILASVPQHTGYTDLYQHSDNEKNEANGTDDSVQSFASDIPDNSASSRPLKPDFQDQSANYLYSPPTAPSSPPHKVMASVRDKSVLRAASGFFLLWPLYLVGEMLLGTEEIRAWTIGRLRHVGDAMGIMQAHTLAMALARRVEIRAWDVDDKPIRFATLERRLERERSERRRQVSRMMMDTEDTTRTGFAENTNVAEEDLGVWDYRVLDDIGNHGEAGEAYHPYPSNETALTRDTTLEASLPGPLDEWYPMDQAITSHQSTETLQMDMGSLENEAYAFQEADMDLDITISNADRSGTVASAWLSAMDWPQET